MLVRLLIYPSVPNPMTVDVRFAVVIPPPPPPAASIVTSPFPPDGVKVIFVPAISLVTTIFDNPAILDVRFALEINPEVWRPKVVEVKDRLKKGVDTSVKRFGADTNPDVCNPLVVEVNAVVDKNPEVCKPLGVEVRTVVDKNPEVWSPKVVEINSCVVIPPPPPPAASIWKTPCCSCVRVILVPCTKPMTATLDRPSMVENRLGEERKSAVWKAKVVETIVDCNDNELM